MTRCARLASLLAAASLAGCANLPVGSDGLSPEQRRTQIESVDAWEIRGRLAVATGERAFQGSFRWQQRADALDLTVRGPLGAGVLQVTGSPDALTVTARGDTRVLEDPEAQLSELLGWWLPVGSLHAWLLGLPDPGFAATTELGADGTLAVARAATCGTSRIRAISSRPRAARRRSCRGASTSRTASSQLRLTIDDWHALQ